MVDIRENNPMKENKTPEVITVSMILEDLENGDDRTVIKSKYNLDAWEVKKMIDHPKLKGKKAKKVKRLSFSFVDDTVEEVNPNQIDIEDAIADELEGRKIMDVQDQIQESTPNENMSMKFENVSEIQHESEVQDFIYKEDIEDRIDQHNEKSY